MAPQLDSRSRVRFELRQRLQPAAINPTAGEPILVLMTVSRRLERPSSGRRYPWQKGWIGIKIDGWNQHLGRKRQGDHGAFPAHAHINLLGWVTSAIFGGYYALNPAKAARKIAMIHYGLYNVGLVVMLPALYLMLQGNTALEPTVALGSLIVAAAVLMFAFVVFSSSSVRLASEFSSATR